MFSTPEIYLQADLAYHRDQIRAQFADAPWLRGTPVRRKRRSRQLRRARSVASQPS